MRGTLKLTEDFLCPNEILEINNPKIQDERGKFGTYCTLGAARRQGDKLVPSPPRLCAPRRTGVEEPRVSFLPRASNADEPMQVMSDPLSPALHPALVVTKTKRQGDLVHFQGHMGFSAKWTRRRSLPATWRGRLVNTGSRGGVRAQYVLQ